MHPTDKGRKIHDKDENPFDNFIYIFVHKLAPIFHKLGLTPIPDKVYTISYEFWATHTDLSSSSDEPVLDARYQDTIVARAEYYVHQLRADLQAATLKNSEYDQRLDRMRVDLINKPDYMKTTAYGNRTNIRHPKYF